MQLDNLIQKLLNDSNLTTKEKELLMKQMKNKGL